jgi:hypothetical protein
MWLSFVISVEQVRCCIGHSRRRTQPDDDQRGGCIDVLQNEALARSFLLGRSSYAYSIYPEHEWFIVQLQSLKCKCQVPSNEDVMIIEDEWNSIAWIPPDVRQRGISRLAF